MNHARALGRPKDAYLGSINIDDGAGHLHARVGGHDGLGEQLRVLRRAAQRSLHGRHGRDHLLCGKGHPDNAGRGREDLVEDAVKCLCRGDAGLNAGFDPGCPVAQFALPALTSTAPTLPPVDMKMTASDRDRRCNDLISGKHHRCIRGLRSDGNRDVQLSAGLDSGLDCAPLKSERKGLGICFLLIGHALTLSREDICKAVSAILEFLHENVRICLREEAVYAA